MGRSLLFYEVEGGGKEVKEIKEIKKIIYTIFTNLLKFSKFYTHYTTEFSVRRVPSATLHTYTHN